MKTPQKWLIVGLVVGVLGILVALLGLVLPGLVLVVIGVALLAILGLGFPSPRAVKRRERTLYEDEDEKQPDPDERFVSVRLARQNRD